MSKKIAPVRPVLSALLSAALFFVAVCLCSAATAKRTSLILAILTFSAVFLFYSRLRDRIRLPLLALGLVVLAGGLSNLYAVSGKFALSEFIKLLNAFCLTLLLLAFTGGRHPDRRIAAVLSSCTALAGLVSIDLLSTRLISTPVLGFLESLGCNYSSLSPIEKGVRMVSIFITPNVFAGCAGIGVLLGLGLASTAEGRLERAGHLVCLFVNSLSFVLVFSMGASAMIAAAFLAYLMLEAPESRIDRLLLMSETLVVTLLAVFPISKTSFSTWTGFQPVPLLCLAAGAALLCITDALLVRRAAAKLRRHGKAVLIAAVGIFAGLALLVAVACSLTGGVTLQPGVKLRRAAYPEPGSYTIIAEADGEVQLAVESQNLTETQMHITNTLYRGPLSGAAFCVPEDSKVVYFTFSAAGPVRLEQAACQGEAGDVRIPLGYPLLPGFIANRLQGLRANENAIQRVAFFEDGLKLFWRSPLIGQGLGAFANGCFSVQSFGYATDYVHNHYIQTLDETGIIGLLLFLGLLGVSAVAVWRGRRQSALAPALGAALVFMAGHAAVEVVFSIYCYLPIAFGVFGLVNLCCGDVLPERLEKPRLRDGLLLGSMALILVFTVFLYGNMFAYQIANGEGDLSRFEEAAQLDRFEWPDHLLAYVMGSLTVENDAEIRQKADQYALRLGKLQSNTIPLYLAEYYFYTGRQEQGFEQAERYVSYTSASQRSWREAFDLLEKYEQDSPEYRAGVRKVAGLLEDWNAQHLGTIKLTGQNEAFLARLAG